ncbi:MAG: cyclase family protein [Candidatus Malihini olakiniferum]
MFSAFPGVQRNTLYTVVQDGFFAQQLTFVTQTGTHIDALAHFSAGKRFWMVLPIRSCSCHCV